MTTTPTTQREADERRLFESDLRAEAHEAGGTPDIEAHVAEMLQRAPNGDYATLWVHFRWEGWQRALAVREAMPASLPRAIGVSRDAESPGGKGILIFFKRPLCDGELRALHSALARQAAPEAPAAATDQPSAGQVDERALFEGWHRSKFATKHLTGQPTRDMHNGIYAEKYGPENQQHMWEAWQARASLTLAAPVDLRKLDLIDYSKGVYCTNNTAYVALRPHVAAALTDATPTALQAASQQAGAIAWTDKEIAEACVKAGLGILECHALLTTLRAPQAATTASADCTAVQLVRDLVQLWGNESLTTDEYNEAMSAIEDRMHAYIDGRAPVQAAQPALPAERMKCEDCDGRGHDGELHYQGHFQPPEPDMCGACQGSGMVEIPVQTGFCDDCGTDTSQLPHWSNCKYRAAPGAAQTTDKGQTNE